MTPIIGIPVKDANSSNISMIGFDEPSRTLEVQFFNGSVYQYHPITAEFYNEMMAADSIGGHFNKHVVKNQNIEYLQIKAKKK